MNKIHLLSFLSIVFVSCEQETPVVGTSGTSGNGTATNQWSIPANRVFDGGPGKDGIPALVDPDMVESNAELSYLDDDDLVLGIKIGDDIRAYTHPVLDWHEIINDEIGGIPMAITYCPLTGTGFGWGREVNGQVTTFGVSGLLYNSNLIPYDRATDSNWSQMLSESVNGVNIGQNPVFYPLLETTWKQWKAWYPNTVVTSSNTGISRRYGDYPYGDYRESSNLIFPVENSDDRLHRKERVLGVRLGNQVKAYTIASFGDGKIIEDELTGQRIVSVGSNAENWAVSFLDPAIDGTRLEFELTADGPNILVDQFSNTWNVFGEAVSGPNEGALLEKPESFIGFWFAWAAFFPTVELYQQ